MTSEETLGVTLILTKKLLFISIVAALMVSGVSAEYSYEDSGNYDFGDETSFSVPEYDSQQEIFAKLVAPFLFVSVLLQMLFSRALRFAFVDKKRGNNLLTLMEDNKPKVNREATLMAITATAILIPTPFWNYVIWAVGSIGIIIVTIFAGTALLLLYYFLKG